MKRLRFEIAGSTGIKSEYRVTNLVLDKIESMSSDDFLSDSFDHRDPNSHKKQTETWWSKVGDENKSHWRRRDYRAAREMYL